MTEPIEEPGSLLRISDGEGEGLRVGDPDLCRTCGKDRDLSPNEGGCDCLLSGMMAVECPACDGDGEPCELCQPGSVREAESAREMFLAQLANRVCGALVNDSYLAPDDFDDLRNLANHIVAGFPGYPTLNSDPPQMGTLEVEPVAATERNPVPTPSERRG